MPPLLTSKKVKDRNAFKHLSSAKSRELTININFISK